MSRQYPDYTSLLEEAIHFVNSPESHQAVIAHRTSPAETLLQHRTIGILGPRQSGKSKVIKEISGQFPGDKFVAVFSDRLTRRNYEKFNATSNVETSDTYLLRKLITNTNVGKTVEQLPEEFDVFKNKSFLVFDDGISMMTYHGIKRSDLYNAIAELYRGFPLPIIIMLG